MVIDPAGRAETKFMYVSRTMLRDDYQGYEVRGSQCREVSEDSI
jgi:hypothetical protein